MEEMDDLASQESSETTPTSTGSSVARNTPSPQISVNEDNLWELVRRYKQIQEQRQQLAANNPDLSPDSSVLSTISNQSLLEQQVETLAELDSQAREAAENIALQGSSDNPEGQALTAVAIGIEANPPRGARPSVAAALATIKSQKQPKQPMTEEQLCESIEKLTSALNCEIKALPSSDVTHPEAMDTTT